MEVTGRCGLQEQGGDLSGVAAGSCSGSLHVTSIPGGSRTQRQDPEDTETPARGSHHSV